MLNVLRVCATPTRVAGSNGNRPDAFLLTVPTTMLS